MRILGIETSCDETAVCLIDASGSGADLPHVDAGKADFSYHVLGNALYSQAALHAEYGGVFPNLAKREHGKNLVPLLEDALRQAGELIPSASATLGAELLPLRDLLAREKELLEAIVPFLVKYERPNIDAIAVTMGPGLEPALWVGINFAKALASVWQKPLVAVNHMEGHIVMPLMEHSHTLEGMRAFGKMREIEWPVLSLLISGGHTELIFSEKFGAYTRLGETRDDAAGEAFDKVARLMDLPYPGGPEISRLAAIAREKNIRSDVKFTRPMLSDRSYDFSFSGLKTAVRNLVGSKKPLTDEMRMAIAREFEDTVAEVLVEKTLRAADECGARTIILGGGVSANTRIRELLMSRTAEEGAISNVLTTSAELATDNALMIALAGYFHAVAGQYAEPDTIVASGNLKLETAV